MIHKRLAAILTLMLCVALTIDAAAKRFTLVIDAGHGGHDAGAVGRMSKEKTLTLRYALAFGRVIEQNCPDVKVVYTRRTDRFLELWQRAEIANRAKADLFVSVHINSLPRGYVARGYQTYTLGRSRRNGNNQGFIENLEVAKRENAVILYEKDYKEHYAGFDPNSPESNILFELVQDKNMEQSIELAKFMQRNICTATGRQDKGVHQDNLAVLRLTSMPGCLLELGFISTADEEQYMNSDRALNQYARGFYNAFVAYKNKVAPATRMAYKPVVEDVQPEPEPKAEPQRLQASQPVASSLLSQPAAPPVADTAEGEAPVFKVQILTSGSVLKPGSRLLKGRTDADYYREGRIYKYTVGNSADYQQIYRLRKELLGRFPEAFIIAFRGGVKMDVNEAIREYKRRKVKR